jgi:glycosyltransferase involved in cell wall biosynthesis
MRIAINCRSILLSNRTGIGRYTWHLLDHLGKIDRDDQYILYASKRLFDFKRRLPVFSYPNFKPCVDYFGLVKPRADIYHLPSPAPLGRYEGKLVVTIHDLVYKTYPQAHTPQTIALTEEYMGAIIRQADRIICISENTRRDLHRFFDVDTDKTCTVLNGVDHNIFFPLPDKQEAHRFCQELGAAPGFMLFVGTIEPRKNLPGLLQAMAQLKKSGTAVPQLVVVGMRGWMMEKVMPLIEQLDLKSCVFFTGFITDAQLNMLYNTCGVFVFPSFYEGFGFPIVEAFCAGAAVVASKTSSCGEIAGDAAVLINPADHSQIAAAITRLLEDPKLVQELRRKALERARLFSFEATAQRTLDIYKQIVNRS